jgi:hypothetical protein
MLKQLISASSTIKTALEYSELASLPELSEAQADRMEFILIEASNDPALSFWVNEIDHCLGHQLGIADREIDLHQYSLLQKKLGMLLDASTVSWEDGKMPSEDELRCFLKNSDALNLSPNVDDTDVCREVSQYISLVLAFLDQQ